MCLSASAPEISLALNAVYLSKNCQIEPYIKTLHSKAEEVTLIIAKTGAHLDFGLIPIYAMFRGFHRFLDLKGNLQMSLFFFFFLQKLRPRLVKRVTSDTGTDQNCPDSNLAAIWMCLANEFLLLEHGFKAGLFSISRQW